MESPHSKVVKTAKQTMSLPVAQSRSSFTMMKFTARSLRPSAARRGIAFLAQEPARPSVRTAIPGPVGRKLAEEHGDTQDNRQQFFYSDLQRSIGNYVYDVDGNSYLDLYCSIASLPVGYSNPRLLAAARSPESLYAIVNRPSLGSVPSGEWPRLVKESFMSVAPKGMDNVFVSMCGSCANENAFKIAFMYHQRTRRGWASELSAEELSSCLRNQAPGTPDLSILSFRKSFHGRLLASLSTTRSKAIHKVDIPAFDWPVADFPQLRYPLDQFAHENVAEEARCLAQVEDIIISWKSKRPVAAIIVEPIQSEGGDNHASPSFFKELRNLALKQDVLLIVDEVQTGVGATGTFWAHQGWLDAFPDLLPPDIVTFSKKMQSAGLYFSRKLAPQHPFRSFGTWMGDPMRAIQTKAIIQEIREQNLIELVKQTGGTLLQRLRAFEPRSKGYIQDARGLGTFIAFSSPTPEARDRFLVAMRQNGVHMGGSGDRAVRFRPMLVLQEKHVDVFFETLEKTIAQLDRV